MSVCACEGERERKRATGRERERERKREKDRVLVCTRKTERQIQRKRDSETDLWVGLLLLVLLPLAALNHTADPIWVAHPKRLPLVEHLVAAFGVTTQGISRVIPLNQEAQSIQLGGLVKSTMPSRFDWAS